MAKHVARISVSDMVKFWKWYTDASDISIDEMLEKEQQVMRELTAERFQTRPQILGEHLHAILEDPDAYAVRVGEETYYGNESLGLLTREDLAEIMTQVGIGRHEVPALKVYVGDEDTDIVVSMRVDHVHGFEVRDTKTVWSEPSEFLKTKKAETYEDSPQALFYADAFGATSVRYVLFYMGEQPPLLTLRAMQTVTVDTSDHDHVHDQCQRVVSTFWHWCKIHGLDKHYLRRFTNKPEMEII